LNNSFYNRASWSAADRAWRLASQTLQLLSMLEVLREQAADDIDSLRLLTRMATAFPAQMSRAERELPIDPAGRTRDALQAAQTKALLMHRLAVRAGRKQAVTSGHLPQVAKSLRDVARACDGLGEWIAEHDRAFDDPNPTQPMPLEAA
jgi:hypothetical protein